MVGAAAAAAGARRLAVRASTRGLSDSSATLMRRQDFFFGATLGLLGIADNGGVWGQVRTFTSIATGGGGGGVCAAVFNDFVLERLSNTLVYQINMFSSSVNPQNQGGTGAASEDENDESKKDSIKDRDDLAIETIVSEIITRENRQKMDTLILEDLYQRLGVLTAESAVPYERLVAIVSCALRKSSPTTAAEREIVISLLVHHFKVRGQGGPSTPSIPAAASNPSEDEESMSSKLETVLTYLDVPDGPRTWLTAKLKALEKEGKVKGTSKWKWKLLVCLFWFLTIKLWCESVPKAYHFVVKLSKSTSTS